MARKLVVPRLSTAGFVLRVEGPHAAALRVREVLNDILSRDPDHLSQLDLETLQELHAVLLGTLAKRRAKGLAAVESWLADHKANRRTVRSADAVELLERLAFETGDARFATGVLERGTLQQLRGETGANAPQAPGLFAWLCFAYGALVDGLGENTADNRKGFAKELRKKK